MESASVPTLRLQGLTLSYRTQPVVLSLTGEFAPGSLTAVVGPNGAGKSTLLAALAAQSKPAAGSIEISAARTACVAWLPQRPGIDRSFPMRALDLVAMGLWRQAGGVRAPSVSQRHAVLEALAQVGLSSVAQHTIGELSAGQFQRLLFARLIVQDAPVVLLDEPFAAVDEQTAEELLALIGRWRAERRTVIAVLHDLEQVRRHFPSTLLLARRCIAWGGTAGVLAPEHLARARLEASAWHGTDARNRMAA